MERGGCGDVVDAERSERNIIVRLVCAIQKIECLKGIYKRPDRNLRLRECWRVQRCAVGRGVRGLKIAN